jgi:hypothetical protein
MATQGKRTAPTRKANLPSLDFPIPPVSLGSPRRLKQDWEQLMGWIAACVLVVLLLPLLGMLYLDVLEIKSQAKQQVEKVEKLRRKVEKEKRDDSNSRIPPR